MEYKMCRKCKFEVEENTKQCPNCGVLCPTEKTGLHSYAFKGSLIGIGFGFIMFLVLNAETDLPVGIALFLSLLTGWILGVIPGIGFGVIRKVYLKVSEIKLPNRPYSIKDEQKIDQSRNDSRIKKQKISESRIMKYRKCRKCTFWIEKKTKLCPNCGVLYPAEDTTIEFYGFKGAKIGTGIGFLMFLFSLAADTSDIILSLVSFSTLGCFLGVVFGVVFGIIHKGYLKASEVKFLNHPYLIKDEEKIGQRQNDLRIKEQKISEAMEQLEQLAEKPTEQFDLAKKTLQNALDAVLHQKNEYKLKLWEIKLLRWYNPLKPLILNINSDAEPKREQCDFYLKKLEDIRSKGKELLTEIQQPQQPDVFDKGKSENYTEQLGNGLEAVDKLIAEVEERRAALDIQDVIEGVQDTIKEVSFIQESFPAENPMIESTLDQVSCLDALVPDLDTFSSDLDKLEEAYFRLEAEKEIKRDFS
ncbi:MAG: hypothetical protein GY795_26605 [Desulfobacterales bacterium]|nr:hypothetical protein [Desulfobacterales bacterium]